MINSEITNGLNRSPLPLVLVSIVSGAIAFLIATTVDYTPIPLALAILLLMVILPGTIGFRNESFGAAIISGAVPVCAVFWAPYARMPLDLSNLWTDISVVLVGLGTVIPFATISYIAGLSLYDRSALRDRSRYLVSRITGIILLFLIILTAHLHGILSAGRVN